MTDNKNHIVTFVCDILEPREIKISNVEGLEEDDGSLSPLTAFTIYDPLEKFDVTVYLSQEDRMKLKILL
jgi:hypothetical protein